MKEILQNLIQTIRSYIKKEWKSLLIMLFIGLDVIPYYKATTEYNKNESVVEYNQLHQLITGADANESVEKVTTTQLLQNLTDESEVYFVKESEDKVNILSKDVNRTMLVKELPALSMTFTLEARLLDNNIAYKWVEKKKAPQMLVVKVLSSSKFYSFALLLVLLYFFMMSSVLSLIKEKVL